MVDFDITFDDLKGPILFISGMMVGVILVAIIWYLVHLRNAHKKRQEQKAAAEPQEREVESEAESHYSPGAILVQDSGGDYLLEDKSQLGGIIDFKKVPRRESDRQQARRDLVIQMLIAESMSK